MGSRNKFKDIQKTRNGVKPNKNRKFLPASEFVESSIGSHFKKFWYPTKLLAMLRSIFNNIAIDVGLILHIKDLPYQGAHQDDKNQASVIAALPQVPLNQIKFEDLHWVIFAALGDDQYIRVALEGNPTNLTKYHLKKGSITFMLTNTWHEGDEHHDPLSALKLFIDSYGQPADTDLQRYFDLNDRQTTALEREAIIANAKEPHFVEVVLD